MRKLLLLAAAALLVISCTTTPSGMVNPPAKTVPPAKSVPPAKNVPATQNAPLTQNTSPAQNAPSDPKDLVLLGERVVDFKADHDTIAVGNYEGSFRSLLFKVEKNDIELFNLVILYGNGEKQRMETRLIFKEGSRSRLIDFAGGKRRIKTIQFTYKTVGTWLDGKARLVVYGMK